MNYEEALKAIGDHLHSKFSCHMGYGLKSMAARLFEDKKVLKSKLPDVDADVFQLYLDEMYNTGLIVKDDGVTVYFDYKYVESTSRRPYF